MKKLLSLLLVFSLLLSLSLLSCEKKTEKPKDEGEEKEPTREITAEEKAIFDDVIFIMEDDTYDTNEFIAKFFCDFSIDQINTPDLPYSRIYKIGDVVALENLNGETTYQKVIDGKLHHVYRTNDGAKLYLEKSEEYPYSYPLSVFTVFGIDMSQVYSASEPEQDEPMLKYEDLYLSEDKKSVTFSDDYLEDLAKYLCVSLDPSEKEMKEFLKNMKAEGVYTIDDETVKFTIEGKFKTLGEIKLEASYTQKDGKPSEISMTMSMSVDQDGVPITTTIEHNISGMTYAESGELKHLVVQTKSTTEYQVEQNGVTVDYEIFSRGIYRLGLVDNAPKYIDVDIRTESKARYLGQFQNSISILSVRTDSDELYYNLNIGDIIDFRVKFSFGTPQNVTIPEDIYTVLPE